MPSQFPAPPTSKPPARLVDSGVAHLKEGNDASNRAWNPCGSTDHHGGFRRQSSQRSPVTGGPDGESERFLSVSKLRTRQIGSCGHEHERAGVPKSGQRAELLQVL